MGKVQSKDYPYFSQYEQQKEFLLNLLNEKFEEFKSAVASNKDL
jgi:hypothetical protein